MLTEAQREIVDHVKEAGVDVIQLQFTDILGTLKNVSITAERLPHVLVHGVMFDGSSIQGFTRVHESDMYLRPDLSTFAVFPWLSPDGDVIARFICDVYTPKGEPFTGSPRHVLKKVVEEAQELGYTLYAGMEPEFFLLETDEKGNPINVTSDKAGYFDLLPIDRGEDARRDIVKALEKMGFQIEAAHHEVAPGQHEIDFRFADAITAADNLTTFKFVTKVIARRHQLHATFIPKPLIGENGSGLHIHQSLFADNRNVFAGEKESGLSPTALYYAGGLLAHARAITAITNPTVNSYKRLIPGYEAPVDITWSEHNRSALIRIPAERGEATRLEFRSPDPAANPYLALAVMLKAGLDGIKNQIDPGPQTRDIAYDLSVVLRKERGIESLPDNLKEALESLRADTVIQEALGSHVYENFLKAKLIEWSVYRSQVHQWELDQYLSIL